MELTPHFDQQPTLPSSEQPLVLRYCKECKSMKPKDGPRADSHNFICGECRPEE